jgi:GH24 family phage-related lysozyme (muramidase)
MNIEVFPGDENKTVSYIDRRNSLLQKMKKENWDIEEQKIKKPLKQKQKVYYVDFSKTRNKFN